MIPTDSVRITADSAILVPSEESTPDHILVKNISLLRCSIFAISIFVLLALWAACTCFRSLLL